MTLVAQDQRGNAATLLYAGGGELAICLVLRDAKADVVTAASGVTHLAATVEPLSVDTALSAPRSANSAGMTIVAGRVGPSVSGVRVARSDGVDVEATVSAGHFVAWWPTQDSADSILALDRGGRPVVTVPGLK
jgi:hypothetical protein